MSECKNFLIDASYYYVTIIYTEYIDNIDG